MGLVWFKILVAPFIFGGGKNITFSTVFGGGGGFCAADLTAKTSVLNTVSAVKVVVSAVNVRSSRRLNGRCGG